MLGILETTELIEKKIKNFSEVFLMLGILKTIELVEKKVENLS